jgi:hypothetical protein
MEKTSKCKMQIKLQLLQNPTKWWLLWGILTPVLFISGLFSLISREAYMMLFFEFLPPAFFGLWVLDRNNFKENSLKFAFLLTISCCLIFLFELTFAWISVFILLGVMWYIKFGKELFLWSFGLMILYGILGLIPLFSILWVNDFSIQQALLYTLYREFVTIVILLFALFAKGAIFGSLVQLFAKRKRLDNV